MNCGIIALVFRCKITGGNLTTNDEATAFRWATEPEVTGTMDEAYAIRVLHALREAGTPAVWPHDSVRLIQPRSPEPKRAESDVPPTDNNTYLLNVGT